MVCEYRTPRALLDAYGSAVTYVAVTRQNGDDSIGSAFHIGDGVLITARHVVDGHRIDEIAVARCSINSPCLWYERVPGASGGCQPGRSTIKGPLFHPDPTIDIAVLALEGLEAPAIPLGGHLDDWLDDSLVLSEALVMGYPPIPHGRAPQLVVARAEVSAITDLRGERHPRFILSSMARGGFSGGPAISCGVGA